MAKRTTRKAPSTEDFAESAAKLITLAKQMLAELDTMPAVFTSLADQDGGTDPNVVETAPARAALARSQQLAPFVDLIETIAHRASDDVLASASSAKALSIPAYAIGRTNAPLNKTLRSALAPALSFYGGPARLRTARAARAAKKAAKKSTGES